MKIRLTLVLILLINSNDALAGVNSTRFIVAAALAGASIYISEVLQAEEEKLHFYNLQGEFYYGARRTSVLAQGFALERRMSSWFSLGAELITEQFISRSYSTFGAGLGPQFRWYLFGNSQLSPYLGYTADLFYAYHEFPKNGSNFTFRLIYMLGAEYKIVPEQRLRLSIGHIHHSNNNLYDKNPGYDGIGLTFNYIWAW